MIPDTALARHARRAHRRDVLCRAAYIVARALAIAAVTLVAATVIEDAMTVINAERLK